MIQLLPDFLDEIKLVLKNDFQKFIECYDSEPFRGLRVNTIKTTVEKIKGLLDFPWEQVPFSSEGTYIPNNIQSLGNSPLHHCGAFYIQEPSAMSAVTLLDPRHGDFVLDLCAAPGGKSTQIASKLNGKGLLWANEIVKSRAMVLLSNIERMGVKNAVVSNESPENLCKNLAGCFDKILVDAPCSGEGMFRKEPQAMEHWSREHVIACADRQLNILESAKIALKPGGTIVYSTCTFSPEENEGVLERFLKNNPDFEIVEENESFGMNTAQGTVRIFPFHGGEGHFAVKLRNKGFSEYLYSFESINYKSKRKNKPLKKPAEDISEKQIKDFYDSLFLNRIFGENFSVINNKIFIMPEAIKSFPGLEKCSVLRAGIMLGEIKSSRIEPAHSAFMAADKDDCVSAVDLTIDDDRLLTYLKGGEIEISSSLKGYTAVCCEGMTTGFGKAVGGTLKNKYPKGLRLL